MMMIDFYPAFSLLGGLVSFASAILIGIGGVLMISRRGLSVPPVFFVLGGVVLGMRNLLTLGFQLIGRFFGVAGSWAFHLLQALHILGILAFFLIALGILILGFTVEKKRKEAAKSEAGEDD